MKSAVLFIVYNRPTLAKNVFESIRFARPPRLYIAADGPKEGCPKDSYLCTQVRSIAKLVDWPCQVKTLFSVTNLGCRLGEATAMSWFFSEESEGIILEDDTLPLPCFFQFCDDLLEIYRYNNKIGMISGSSFTSSYFKHKYSYYFSRFPHAWGWAGWRRSWNYYDLGMSEWPSLSGSDWLSDLKLGDALFNKTYTDFFDKAHSGKIDSWDYQWIFALWRNNLLTIVPSTNLIVNIGFNRSDAVHTKGRIPSYVRKSLPKSVSFPLTHPAKISPCVECEKIILRKVWGITPFLRLKSMIYHLPLLGQVLHPFRILGNRILVNLPSYRRSATFFLDPIRTHSLNNE